MIRPITVICWILALGAGLYLYRAKHEVELMDKHIEQIARDTNDIRAESRHLLDEWIRLGEPEQLRKYSDQYLGLKSIMPTQFVRMSDLPGRLPEPRADPVDEPAVAAVQLPPGQLPPGQLSGGQLPLGQLSGGLAAPDQQSADTDEADADDMPVPPIPPANVTLISATGPVIAPPLQARPVTPRNTSVQQDAGVLKPAVAIDPRTGTDPKTATDTKTAEDLHPAMPRPTSLTIAGARPAVSGQPQQPGLTPPRQAAVQERNLPPLQAQQTSPSQPQQTSPLQAQQTPPSPVQAGRLWDSRPLADNRVTAMRPAQIPPYQNSAQTQPYQPPAFQNPPVQDQRPPVLRQAAEQIPRAPAGSLLGMSRGGVPAPMPLPAPMPVNATWTGPSR
jgi:hypothetical protein